MISHAPATGAFSSASTMCRPAASARATAAAAPSTGAQRPSPSRAAGINPSGQRGALDELQRGEHRDGDQERVADVAHVHVCDQPGGQGRADRVCDQADQPLGFEGAERHRDDHPSVPRIG